MKTTESHEPTPAALRAAAAIVSCGTKILGGLQIPLARIIDSELTQERERARELEAALALLVSECTPMAARLTGETRDSGVSMPKKDAVEQARAVLAMSETLRADREGSK
jgi:hypothetical protein